MTTDTDNLALQAFCNRILQIGLNGNWNNHLAEPVQRSTTLFARLYIQRADKSAIEAAAAELEGALTVCATARIESMEDVSSLIEDLYELVDSYPASPVSFR